MSPSTVCIAPVAKLRVTIDGRDFYLGPYKSKASYLEYDRLINEWLASGRRLSSVDSDPVITVVEVIAAYRRFAKTYYVKHGRPTGELRILDDALKPLKRLYGRTSAIEFGPKRLKALRQTMIAAGWTRNHINKQVGRIKRMFKWAAEEELIPGSVFQNLTAVAGLRKGRSAAPDRPPIEPVPDEVFQATLPHLPAVIADIARLQRLAGMRPSEVCILRPCDLDTSGDVWLYRPSTYKTEHHGRARVVYLGPKAKAILRPYLLRPADAYCFSPQDTVRRMYQERQAARVTPLSCGNRPGTNCKRKPRRKAGEHYTKNSYNKAIARAIAAANEERKKDQLDPLPHWSANRLRHSAATDIRRRFGLEAAQVILGHAKADVTQVYAEANMEKAAEVARRIG